MFAARIKDQKPFVAALVGIVVLSWAALALWEQSRHDRFLGHEAIGDSAGVASYLALAAFFVFAWTLMTLAMMLPTILPLILLFRRVISARRDALQLSFAVISGYIAVWAVFGATAHLADAGIHLAVERAKWLDERAWLLAAIPLLVAGGYQFTPLKYICLEKCRSPFSFIAEHWNGRAPRLAALRLGVHHGLFCVGCCWSLMLVIFAVGAANVVFMLALGALMAVEKNMPWGRRISLPVGVVLVAAGAAIVIVNLDLHIACAHGGGEC